MLATIKQRAARLKLEIYSLYLALRDPATPWYVRFLIAGILAYAASPIDLIPDFIPVIGYLDDLILLPIAIALAIRLLPANVMEKCRKRAQVDLQDALPVSWVAAVAVVAVWIGVCVWFALWLGSMYN